MLPDIPPHTEGEKGTLGVAAADAMSNLVSQQHTILDSLVRTHLPEHKRLQRGRPRFTAWASKHRLLQSTGVPEWDQSEYRRVERQCHTATTAQADAARRTQARATALLQEQARAVLHRPLALPHTKEGFIDRIQRQRNFVPAEHAAFHNEQAWRREQAAIEAHGRAALLPSEGGGGELPSAKFERRRAIEITDAPASSLRHLDTGPLRNVRNVGTTASSRPRTAPATTGDAPAIAARLAMPGPSPLLGNDDVSNAGLMQMFRDLDVDHSGRLSSRELAALYRKREQDLGVPVNADRAVRDLLRGSPTKQGGRFGKNADAEFSVGFDEFAVLMLDMAKR